MTAEASSGAPLDSVVVTGVPDGMGDSVVGAVRATEPSGDTLGTVALTRRRDSTSVTLYVPVHPGLNRRGGAVEIELTDGSMSCPPFAFDIDSLARAPGTFRRMAAHRDSLLDLHLHLAGVSRQALADARPDTVSRLLLPLLLVQRVLDGTDELEGLNALVDDPPEEGGGPSAARWELTDAVLAKSGLPTRLAESRRALERYVEGSGPKSLGWYRALEARERAVSTREGSRGGRGGDGGGAELSSRGGPAHFAVAGASVPSPVAYARETVDLATASARSGRVQSYETYAVSPEKLDVMMDVAMWAHDSPAVKGLSEVAEGSMGLAASLASASGVGAPLGQAMGGAAFGMWLDRTFRDFLTKLLPRNFVDIEIRMSPEDYEEDRDDEGQIRRIEVKARSERQVLDQKILESLLHVVGDKLPTPGSNPPPGILEVVDGFVWGEIWSSVLSDAVEQAGGQSGIVPIPAREFVADVTDPEWSVVRYLRGESIRLTGEDRSYVPVDVGSTWLRIFVRPTPADVLADLPSIVDERGTMAAARKCNFGCKNIRRDVDVEVHQIEVVAEPAVHPVRPGQTVEVRARVENAEDGGLRWRIDGGGGRIVRWESEGNEHRATVQVPDPMLGPVLVSGVSLADKSHLATAGIERSDQIVLTEGLEIQPADACLEPGEQLRFRAVASGRPLDELELEWSAEGGTITDDGLFTAGGPGPAVIEARSPTESSFRASTDAEVRERCLPSCRYSGMLYTPNGDFAVEGRAYVAGALEGAMGSAGGYSSLTLSAGGSPGAGIKLIFPEPYPAGRTGPYEPDLSRMGRGDARLSTHGDGVIGGGILAPEHASVSLRVLEAGDSAAATPMEGTEFREAEQAMQLRGSVRAERRLVQRRLDLDPDGGIGHYYEETGESVIFEADFDAGSEYACEFSGQLDGFSEGMERNIPQQLEEALDAEGVQNPEELREQILEALPPRPGPEEGGGGG